MATTAGKPAGADVLDVLLEVAAPRGDGVEVVLEQRRVQRPAGDDRTGAACIFSARTVATITAASGRRPEARHLMSTNFSKPMSAPKPPR